jgi:phosphoglycolate phosphatase-like HAD superfamily hydrolase
MGSEVLLLDCDGVILNSNELKNHAFYECAIQFGSDVADEFYLHCQENSGISRELKFTHLKEIICKKGSVDSQLLDNFPIAQLCAEFGTMVESNLVESEICLDLGKFRSRSDARWAIVSGGNQSELNRVFDKRGISSFFDLGIHGNPRNKYEIISELMDTEHFSPSQCTFVGDAEYDYMVAKRFNMDFVFISGWSSFTNWREFVAQNSIVNFYSLSDFFNECFQSESEK